MKPTPKIATVPHASSAAPLIDVDAFDERIRRIAREEIAKPDFVHQRSVEAVLGVPAREYLRRSRERAWPSTKERRLIVARTEDVARYFERRITRREPVREDDANEAIVLARVGARRIAGSR